MTSRCVCSFLRINSELITKYQWLHCPQDTEMAFHEMCYETNCQQYFVCKINAKLYLPLNRKRNLSGKFNVKGSPDLSHFIFEINVGKRRIRHTTTLKLNDELLDWLKIRLIPTLISKIKRLGSGLPYFFARIFEIKTNFSCKCFKRWSLPSPTGRKNRMGCYKNNWDW